MPEKLSFTAVTGLPGGFYFATVILNAVKDLGILRFAQNDNAFLPAADTYHGTYHDTYHLRCQGLIVLLTFQLFITPNAKIINSFAIKLIIPPRPCFNDLFFDEQKKRGGVRKFFGKKISV